MNKDKTYFPNTDFLLLFWPYLGTLIFLEIGAILLSMAVFGSGLFGKIMTIFTAFFLLLVYILYCIRLYQKRELREFFLKFLPYGVTLLYLEIAALMVTMSLFTGKIIAVIIGMILTVAYTWQVLGLHHKHERNRKIQLFLMDVHVAVAVVSLIGYSFLASPLNMLDYIIFSFRPLLLTYDLPAIYYLTRDDVKAEFS